VGDKLSGTVIQTHGTRRHASPVVITKTEQSADYFSCLLISDVYDSVHHTHEEYIMRTNVVIDDQLMDKAQKYSGLTTKKGAIEAGLKLLIQLHKQSEVRSLRGKINWEGNLDDMRGLRS
jgi:Arc/MetJ family transcription regulator